MSCKSSISMSFHLLSTVKIFQTLEVFKWEVHWLTEDLIQTGLVQRIWTRFPYCLSSRMIVLQSCNPTGCSGTPGGWTSKLKLSPRKHFRVFQTSTKTQKHRRKSPLSLFGKRFVATWQRTHLLASMSWSRALPKIMPSFCQAITRLLLMRVIWYSR